MKVALTKENFAANLEAANASLADFVIDLSVLVKGLDVLAWCQEADVRYINTSLDEDWELGDGEDPEEMSDDEMYEHTLHLSHLSLAEANFPADGPTAVVDSGMNPGIISHLVKVALRKIGKEAGLAESLPWGVLAKRLGLKTIHISERDTQVSLAPRQRGTFVNDWSPIGFYEEAMAPVQIGWGSHEPTLPKNLFVISPVTLTGGDGRVQLSELAQPDQIFLRRRGVDTVVRSYEPVNGEFAGYCIPHGEAASLNRFLAWDGYRPSVYYCYLPCSAAVESLNEVKSKGYKMQRRYHVYRSSELAGGVDSVGALLFFHGSGLCKKPCYWAGTVVDNAAAREISPEINATTAQVAAGVLSAVAHGLRHPRQGVVFPEALDSAAALKLGAPLLGTLRFDWVPWEPASANFCDLWIR